VANIALRLAFDSGIADLADLPARIGVDPSLTQAATCERHPARFRKPRRRPASPLGAL
jgi:hypothetical protein